MLLSRDVTRPFPPESLWELGFTVSLPEEQNVKCRKLPSANYKRDEYSCKALHGNWNLGNTLNITTILYPHNISHWLMVQSQFK